MGRPLASVLSPVVVLGAAGAFGVAAGYGTDRPAPIPVVGASTGAAVSYLLPVPGPARVVAPFDPPATRYGPGHRGVDLAVPRRGQVRAAAAGTVRFAGMVAGRGVVVIAHADGVVTEYEPVRPAVGAGARVAAGAVVATVRGSHRMCAPDRCLHWSARRAGNYLDPMSLLDELGTVRLLPWSGAPP